MDVGDATNAVQSLWNALPAVVQRRLSATGPQARQAARPRHGLDAYADTLDGFAVRGFSRLACNELAFHYLLDIERRRSESTRRPFLLMLIEGEEPWADSNAATRLFSIVCQSVRETDFVGWYLQNSVLGAAFTQDGGRITRARDIVRDRIARALHDVLPSHDVSQLRLRLYEVLGDDDVRID